MTDSAPAIRIRSLNAHPVRKDGRFVLYWMTAFRRIHWNWSLQRAVEWSVELNRPLIIFEPLRCGYRWANDRIHRFILQGMAENRRRLDDAPALYFPYVEPQPNYARGLLEALAEGASVVVADDYPCFFLPAMLKVAARRLDVLLEAVDSNGLLPLRAADRTFPRAHSFRRFLQHELPRHLAQQPAAEPLSENDIPPRKQLPAGIRDRWPAATDSILHAQDNALRKLPIDHSVRPVDDHGGTAAAEETLDAFIRNKLHRYASDAKHPDDEATSGLSPYLHFGHISVYEIFDRIARWERWTPRQLPDKPTGSRSGWWSMSPDAEAFLDELLTWRELGFNMCAQRRDYDRYESLPDWAKTTLAEHADDPRDHLYSLQELETAQTHDAVWNAAQRQLLREGRLHNYLRMLWGKKILEWTASPQEALHVMIHLNNKYALDGRDPNSCSGIFWVLGRYDRAWGPERPVFGKVRYMSSANTQKKLRMQEYLQRFSPRDDAQATY